MTINHLSWMFETMVAIKLSEWDKKNPLSNPELQRLSLSTSTNTKKLLDALNEKRALQITELKSGIEVSTFSHIGRIKIDNFCISIYPKIKSPSLLKLLRYCYGFRNLSLFGSTKQLMNQFGFEDLLVAQLNTEVEELLARGLSKSYISQNQQLSSPRGRITFRDLVKNYGKVSATLPCRHYQRLEDTQINRVILAGLKLATSVANQLELKRESTRLASHLAEFVSVIGLSMQQIERAQIRVTRLNAAVAPALSLIDLLFKSQGLALEGKTTETTLPGFLFDMNHFFQELLSRFFKDHLVDYDVRDEKGLKGMMRYNPEFNPRRRYSPTPRPDYAVFCRGRLVSLLDAKYRDLWERTLPRDMLYQLVVYAISHRHTLRSSIIYPTVDAAAKEARIDIRDPVYGRHLGQVCLRPVNLEEMAELIGSTSSSARKDKIILAKKLAFGEQH